MDNKENIEHLNLDDVDSVTVVAENEVPELETISVDQNGQVDPISFEYNDFRDTLDKMYENSTEEDSIISSFVIEGDKCRHILTVRFADGSEPKVQNREFDYTDNFKNDFVVPMVEDFSNHNEVFDSSIEVIDSEHCNFIARTSKNDSLCFSNIDIDFANQLRDLLPKQELTVSGPKQLMKVNEKGIGNYLVIILTIIAIGMALAGTVFFTIASR